MGNPLLAGAHFFDWCEADCGAVDTEVEVTTDAGVIVTVKADAVDVCVVTVVAVGVVDI